MSKKSSGGPDTSGQTPNSSWANRLMQTGTSSHETKTNGSLGGIDSPSVCTAVSGNFHPGVCVEMLRGLRGDHGCMTKARMFFTSGAPVQPHAEYESCGVRAQVMFCPIPDVLRDLLNLKCLSSPEEAQKFFLPAGNDPSDSIGIEFSEDGYFPDTDGWKYVLPDGVATRIRFRRRNDDDIVAEWSMAVRDIDIPEEYNLEAAASRLADAFELDQRELRFTDDANLAFQSYSAYFNILVAQARQDEDIGQAAQLGCCPWKLGMLSASLALWDIAWQQSEAPVADQTQPVLVTVNVVSRAFGLLEILESIVATMSGHSGTTAFTSVAAAAEATRKRKQSDEDHLSAQLQQSSPDRSWDPQAQHSGILDTELLRRLLMKAEKDSDTGPYIVKSRAIYNVARQKDKLAKPLAVSDFRSLARAVPTTLGSYDESKDCLILAFPKDNNDEFDIALLDHAKISSSALQAFWQNNCDKRKGKKRATKKPKRQDVPYIPVEQQLDDMTKAELRHQKWCVSFADLVQWSEKKLITYLISIGILWKFVRCPHCKTGKVCTLFSHSSRGWVQRCKGWKCRKFILPHSQHPFFTCAWGQAHIPLRQQVQVLFCNAARLGSGQVHILTGLGAKAVQSLSQRWRQALVRFVEQQQDSKPFGNLQRWVECEVDEVTLRGKRCGNRVAWHQYLGLLERGNRRSLVLVKMKIRTTSVKRTGSGKGSTGPAGPISKEEWKRIGSRYLKNRKILLHSDGARAYRYVKIPGVVTDAVKHKKPRPVYAALWKHRLPRDQAKAHSGSLKQSETDVMWVQKGTQLIDNVWRQLKLVGLPKSTKADEATIESRVREFQFHHWNAEVDKFKAASSVVAAHYSTMFC
ncbi:unnamed protein product [Symbiodinium sp. CCMP2592]|nr:unnamed protein product [Symbiodinium sp. CCMP2592]